MSKNTLPPAVNTGNMLSASWLNQMSEFVNNAGNYVYGANVAYWLNPTGISFGGQQAMYSLQHKYNTLKVVLNLLHPSDVSVRLSKNDDYTATVQPTDGGTHYATEGVKTININLNAIDGWTLAPDELYFAYISIDRDTPSDSDVTIIAVVSEVSTGVIVAPSPALATLSASTVITADYLNKLRAAALGLTAATTPTNVPFCGLATNATWTQANSVFRWNIRHLNRYLHVNYWCNANVSEVKIYFNDAMMQSWGTGNPAANVNIIYDTTALPNGIAEPSFGSTYEIKYKITLSSGLFKSYYIWELPYL